VTFIVVTTLYLTVVTLFTTFTIVTAVFINLIVTILVDTLYYIMKL